MCWWPCCCKGHVHRLTASGSKVWHAFWDARYHWTALPTHPLLAATDGTDVFVIGTRASATNSPADSYGVRAYDGADGTVLWETDVGAEPLDIRYISGAGVVVSHMASFPIANAITLTTAAASNISIATFYGNGGATLTSSSTASNVDTYLEAISGLSGKVSVTGTNFAGGFAITFDSSLAGPTGLFPVINLRQGSPQVFTGTTVAATGLRNVTCLDPSDGSVLWTAMVGPSSATNYTAMAVSEHSSGLAVTYGITGASNNLAILDTSGSILSNVALPGYTVVGTLRGRSLVCDGADYIYLRGVSADVRVSKYNSSLVHQWTTGASGELFTGPLLLDGSDVWVTKFVGSPTFAYRRHQKLAGASGSVLDTFDAHIPYSPGSYLPHINTAANLATAIAPLTDGGFMTCGGNSPAYIASKWDSSFALAKDIKCRSKRGTHVMAFDDDCIVLNEV